MGDNATIEEQGKGPGEELTLPLIILSILIFACFLYFYQNRDWLVVLEQISAWLINPKIHYTPIHVKGILPAFLATIQILVLGTIASRILLKNEAYTLLNRICAIGLGIGFVGLVTILLGIFGALHKVYLNAGILLIIVIILVGGSFYREGRISIRLPWFFLKDSFSIWKFGKPEIAGSSLISAIPIILIFFFIYYHALLTPILHWDALFYHASRSSILFYERCFPLIVGSSTGIGMSANYPPLFSALGAYFYVNMGMIDDHYLRAIPPTMGILTVLVTYLVGKILFEGTNCVSEIHGRLSALFLALTPIFIYASMDAIFDTMLAFYIAISMLFFIVSVKRRRIEYWILFVLFYSFSLLTSYRALYYLFIPILTLFYVFIKDKEQRKTLVQHAILAFALMALVCGPWYLRNLMLLGNPTYPFIFGDKYFNPLLNEMRIASLQHTIHNFLFGKIEIQAFDWFGFLFLSRDYFPIASQLTLLGLVLIMTKQHRNIRCILPILAWCLIFYFTPLIPLAHERHILPSSPALAVLSALPVTHLMVYSIRGVHRDRRIIFFHSRIATSLRSSVILLITMFLLLASIPTSIVGKQYTPFQPFHDDKAILWQFEHPGIDKWTSLRHLYGEHIYAWRWIDERIENERVAMPGEYPPFLKNFDVRHIFYLDSREALPLYHISDPMKIILFLEERGVRYIYAPEWMKNAYIYKDMPFIKFLGSPYFPLIFKSGVESVYRVGLLEDILTKGSPIPVYINFLDRDGWSEIYVINGVQVRDVISGSFTPRLYVATPPRAYLALVKVTFIDRGFSSLTLNFHDDEKVYFNYVTVSLQNTGKWKIFEFITPLSENFVEFGLFASGGNFTISKIEAAPYYTTGTYSFFSLGRKITNRTVPPSLMVHLPILKGEFVAVQINSYGKNISIEIFEGVIQPYELTEWWKRHKMVARSPELPILGITNPTLFWRAEHGIYTLVIVLWDRYEPEMNINLSITIGGCR